MGLLRTDAKFCDENFKGGEHLKYVDVEGRIMLNWC